METAGVMFCFALMALGVIGAVMQKAKGNWSDLADTDCKMPDHQIWHFLLCGTGSGLTRNVFVKIGILCGDMMSGD